MAAKGDLITSDEFNLLKRMVQEEINRRSTSRSRGSMSAYNGSAYQYTMTPAKGVTVTNEHIQKVTKPLDAVNGSSITPTPSGDVEASTVQQAAQKLNELKAKPEVGSNTGCALFFLLRLYRQLYRKLHGQLYRLLHRRLLDDLYGKLYRQL